MSSPRDLHLELRSLDKLSLARFLAIFNGLLMLVGAVIMGFVMDYVSEGQAMTFVPAMLRVAFNALSGLVAGMILGGVYNVVATIISLKLTVRLVASTVELEEAVPVASLSQYAPRAMPAEARKAAERSDKAAFTRAALVLGALAFAMVWFALLFPMESAYRECKEQHKLASGGGARASSPLLGGRNQLPCTRVPLPGEAQAHAAMGARGRTGPRAEP